MPPNGEFSVIAIGASAGGVEALKELFASLPSDIPAAIFVVLHLPPSGPSHLPEILNRVGPLQTHHLITTAEIIRPQEVYIAPPDRHLIVEDGSAFAVTSPKENRHRPAVNPLFRSVALSYGARAIGVILTGALDDGTAGLWEVKRRGGRSVVQSPDEALYPQMPKSAIDHVEIDYVVRIREMAELLTSLCKSETEHEYRAD